MFYFNRKNKAFWTGIGQLTIAIAGLLPLLAFLAIPKVEQELEQKQEDKEEVVELCLERNFEDGASLFLVNLLSFWAWISH